MKVTRFDGRLPAVIPDGCESYRTISPLLLIGGQLRPLAAAIHISELVDVVLRLLQMEWHLQTHEGCDLANEKRAIGGFSVPQRKGPLKVLDISEHLPSVLLAHINAITGRQILNVEVAITRARL